MYPHIHTRTHVCVCILSHMKTNHSKEKGDSLGIVQMVKISPYEQMVYARARTRPKKWDP